MLERLKGHSVKRMAMDWRLEKADIDNNVPEGDAVPLMLTVNFIKAGAQTQLTSTALVKVEK